MQIDIDTRKMDFKKDDILINDGEKFIKISKKDFLKEITKEIEAIKNSMGVLDKKMKQEQQRRKNFVKAFKGANK